MSQAATEAVWKKSRARGSGLLLLLVIAEHTGETGLCEGLSAADLATRARIGSRAVTAWLAKLVKSGELVAIPHDGQPNDYRITLLDTPDQTITPDQMIEGRELTPDQTILGSEPTPDHMIVGTPDQTIQGAGALDSESITLNDSSVFKIQDSTNRPSPSDDGTAHGFEIGSTVYVWSDKRRQDVPVVVSGQTPDFVILSWSDGARAKSLKRKPKHVHREPRKLETFEDLTPLQQVVGKWTRNVQPGEGIPGTTKAFINTVINRLEQRFGTNGHTPTADELDRAWTRVKDQGKIPPTDPDKIPGMLNDYRESAHPSAPVTSPLLGAWKRADKNCTICLGNGTLIDANHHEVACSCLRPVETDQGVRHAG